MATPKLLDGTTALTLLSGDFDVSRKKIEKYDNKKSFQGIENFIKLLNNYSALLTLKCNS